MANDVLIVGGPHEFEMFGDIMLLSVLSKAHRPRKDQKSLRPECSLLLPA